MEILFVKLQLQVLEEENSRLRAELLLCQEAAKQAFLRSANVLNSEAITMFQVRLNCVRSRTNDSSSGVVYVVPLCTVSTKAWGYHFFFALSGWWFSFITFKCPILFIAGSRALRIFLSD